MRFLIRLIQPNDYADTEALILVAAPERRECVQDWPVRAAESGDKGERLCDLVAVDAAEPRAVIRIAPSGRKAKGVFAWT